jgi:hypothetical protein
MWNIVVMSFTYFQYRKSLIFHALSQEMHFFAFDTFANLVFGKQYISKSIMRNKTCNAILTLNTKTYVAVSKF